MERRGVTQGPSLNLYVAAFADGAEIEVVNAKGDPAQLLMEIP